jgi:hypothetical protein
VISLATGQESASVVVAVQAAAGGGGGANGGSAAIDAGAGQTHIVPQITKQN